MASEPMMMMLCPVVGPGRLDPLCGEKERDRAKDGRIVSSKPQQTPLSEHGMTRRLFSTTISGPLERNGPDWAT